MRLERGRELGAELVRLLSPVCERIEIAGGVRRRKAEPHDIEVVAIPKVRGIRTGVMDLATGEERRILTNGLDWFLRRALDPDNPAARLLFKPAPPSKDGRRAPFAERHYIFLYKDEKIDLYAVLPPAQWGVIFTIRTGDAGYTHALVSKGWPKGLYFIDGAVYRVTRKKDGTPVQSAFVRPPEEKLFSDDVDAELVPTPEERDVFAALGLDWVPPEQRVTTETTPGEWEEAIQ